jgi:tRNA threonylcarbamoyladenosine biosynthesis protein TsaE
MLKLTIESLNGLRPAARNLSLLLNPENRNDRTNCIAFYGEMGAGKTTLIKAICQELGVKDITSSPSFSLVNEYVTNKEEKIFHFDFYRLNNTSEAFDLGYEEYFYSDNLCFIEWPDKVEQLLPEGHIKIKIIVQDNNQRIVEIIGLSDEISK